MFGPRVSNRLDEVGRLFHSITVWSHATVYISFILFGYHNETAVIFRPLGIGVNAGVRLHEFSLILTRLYQHLAWIWMWWTMNRSCTVSESERTQCGVWDGPQHTDEKWNIWEFSLPSLTSPTVCSLTFLPCHDWHFLEPSFTVDVKHDCWPSHGENLCHYDCLICPGENENEFK